MAAHASQGTSKQRAASLSVASNIALTGLKLVVALLTGSVSILSEALHSGLDLVAAVMALLAVRRSQEPADAEHRFGHGKFESISGLVEGMLILVAVALILYTAVKRIIHHQPGEIEPGLGILVMGVSAVVNTLVSNLLFRVAKRTDSVALEADAWHLRTDVYTSAGVFAGLGIIGIGHLLKVEWIDHLDPVIAIGVALIITRAAWGITKRSWDHLVDRSLPPEEVERIEELLREHYPQVEEFHRLRTRKSGNERQIDLHLVVPGDMTVAASHELCDHLESDVKRLLPGSEVLIHVEPEAEDGRYEQRE